MYERSGQPCEESDGLVSADGWIMGSYMHGVFDNDEFRGGLLANVAQHAGRHLVFHGEDAKGDREYDRLAGHLREHLDIAELYRWLDLR